MKKLVVAACLAALALALAGCAIAPTPINTYAPTAREVPAASLEIDDFATAKEDRGSGGAYFTGWLPIADKWVKPAFHEAMTAKLKGALSGSGRGPTIQLAVIESGLFMDSLASDSIVFVGIAAAFRERPYKCNVVLNIKMQGKSERREFENVQVANRAFGDLEDKTNFISKCQDTLVDKVAAYLTKAV